MDIKKLPDYIESEEISPYLRQQIYQEGYNVATVSICREVQRILDDERITVPQAIREVKQFIEEIS